MSLLKGFRNDIFISYAQIDNESFYLEEQGWVEFFHQALDIRLKQVFGEPVSIWRDPGQLSGSAAFDESIDTELQNSAILIPILSPRYVRSEYCFKEFMA